MASSSEASSLLRLSTLPTQPLYLRCPLPSLFHPSPSHPMLKILGFNDLFASFLSVKRRIRPTRKALLIGIQTIREPLPLSTPDIVEQPTPRTVGEAKPQASYAPRGRRPKVKKPKRKIVASEIPPLRGPHQDVYGARSLLLETYHYNAEDIVVLVDNDEPDQVQPTQQNILSAIHDLVQNACEGDKFFFLFSGHAKQEESDPGDLEEEDGMDEYILTSDGHHIMDNTLRKALVDPLPVGSFLNAVFDCCHSASLLDLFHFRCNRVYVPWLNKGRRRTKSLWEVIGRKLERVHSVPIGKRSLTSVTLNVSIEGLVMPPTIPPPEPRRQSESAATPAVPTTHARTLPLRVNTGVIRSESVRILSPTADDVQYMSPQSLYCHGACRDDDHFMSQVRPTAQVICLSSSKDGQVTWEDSQGNSMTQHLIRILRHKPHPSVHDLLTDISHAIHKFYVELHEKARKYKKEMNAKNIIKAEKGEELVPAVEVEMHNFQNPQISTHHPLDMTWIFDP